MRRPPRWRAVWLLAVAVVLLLLLIASVRIGSRSVGWHDIVAALGGSTDTLEEAAVAKRIPRTLLAAISGAGLAVAGVVMQGVTRNPLADPGILGVNIGASLAVLVGIVWLQLVSADQFVWVAIIGAGCAAVFVYAVGSLGRGGATPMKLALAGAAVSAALASFTTAVLLPRADIAGTFQSWQIGGVGGATYDALRHVGPFVAVGFAVSMLSARGLNSLALGDEVAAGLGQRVALTRALAALGGVVLCGAVTAVTGPISFVGLVVPHACRLVIGVDHRWLIPLSALVGAALLTGSDVIGRVVARPEEIDVGIVTALIGAPFFIYLVRRQKVRDL